MTSIEVSSQPIIFRASYRDINLITTIVNKAIQLYTESIQKHSPTDASQSGTLTSQNGYQPPTSRRTMKAISRSLPVGRANAVLSKEQVSLHTMLYKNVLMSP